MADIASTDITLTIVRKNKVGRAIHGIYTVAFTLASLTYPALGIPLPLKSVFGMKYFDWVNFDDQDTGYFYTYDYTNHTIRVWYTAAHTHNFTLIGGLSSAGTLVYDATPAIGKAAATNMTMAGADSGTKGGVVAAANGVFAELTTGATGPVCTTTHALRMKVEGH